MIRLIDDSTTIDIANEPGLCGCRQRETSIGGLPCARVMADDSSIVIVPESQWKARIEEMQAKGLFARQIFEASNPFQADQGKLNYCWAFSLTQTIELNRVAAGLPYIELAAESLGGDVSYRNAGNAIDSAIAYAAAHGIASRSFVDHGCISPSGFRQGWEKNAVNFRPIEWWDVGANDMWAESVTVLLTGKPLYVGYDWWGHAVMLDELVIVGDEVCVSGPNTWGKGQRFVLKGSKKVPSYGCFGVRETTFYNPS